MDDEADETASKNRVHVTSVIVFPDLQQDWVIVRMPYGDESGRNHILLREQAEDLVSKLQVCLRRTI